MRKPLSFNGVILEKLCKVCNGTGWHGKTMLFFDKQCTKCSEGLTLNEEGENLCRLIANHLATSECSNLLLRKD